MKKSLEITITQSNAIKYGFGQHTDCAAFHAIKVQTDIPIDSVGTDHGSYRFKTFELNPTFGVKEWLKLVNGGKDFHTNVTYEEDE